MPDVPYEGRGFGVAMKGMGSLSSAIAKQKQTEASTSGASSAGIKDLAAGGVPDPSKAPSAEDIQAAKDAAAGGDQDALKWLIGIGVVGGGLAGAYALSKMKKQPAKEMGAPKSGVVSEKPKGPSSVVKYAPPVTQLNETEIPKELPRNVPAVSKYRPPVQEIMPPEPLQLPQALKMIGGRRK